MTLERKDNNKGYGKNNCKWATVREQNNNKSNQRWVEYKGQRLTFTDANRLAGVVQIETARYRFRHGWTLEQALETPIPD